MKSIYLQFAFSMIFIATIFQTMLLAQTNPEDPTFAMTRTSISTPRRNQERDARRSGSRDADGPSLGSVSLLLLRQRRIRTRSRARAARPGAGQVLAAARRASFRHRLPRARAPANPAPRRGEPEAPRGGMA